MSLGEFLLTVVVLSIYVLVVASLTRLINYDFLTDPLRLWIARRRESAEQAAQQASTLPDQETAEALVKEFTRKQNLWGWLYTFVTCPWCVSFWVALPCAVPVVIIIGWPLWSIVALALAARFLVGIADRWAGESMEIVRG